MSLSVEVVTRPAEVFLRELSLEEGARLRSISRRAKYQSKRSRAMILLASATGMSAPQIAGLVRTGESNVRKVIHAFNEQGDRAQRGGTAAHAARRRALPPAHTLLEVESGPGLPSEGRAGALALPRGPGG